jgi:hypothetical protein
MDNPVGGIARGWGAIRAIDERGPVALDLATRTTRVFRPMLARVGGVPATG